MNKRELSSLRVLAIDDEPFQLQLLRRQFGLIGVVEVTLIDDARAALAQLASAAVAFDLICCDLQMPSMDGVEFVRLLAATGFKGGLLLISGEDQRILQTARWLASAQSLNVVGALHKPVASDQLREALQSLVQPETLKSGSDASRGARRTANELQDAIQLGHLVNFYQPKVDLQSGHLAGVETLVRWQHPRDGLIYPDQFIQVAEQSGLIGLVTRSVLGGLRGALWQCKEWLGEGLSVPVAVNVSMDDLVDHAFATHVSTLLDQFGVPPTHLVLEVTESRLMSDPLATLEILTRMRLKRVTLSIDDFGTGHSSLKQLRDVPFDELKIDRSFVHGAHADSSVSAITQACLDMARELRMKSVAEGVEDEADWHYLRGRGCTLAQGYFIGRPMPAADLPQWLRDWEQRRPALVA